MGEVKEYIFEELYQILGAIAAEYDTLGVCLFGSRVCVDNRSDRDYDFRIKIPKGMGLSKWAESEDAHPSSAFRFKEGQAQAVDMNDLPVLERIDLLKGA